MRDIENKIKINKKLFDTEEPEKGHFDRFESRLNAMNENTTEGFFDKYGFVLKLAAGILVFVTIGILYYSNMFDTLRNRISEEIVAAELPLELQEVMVYYNVITDQKVERIDELAVSAEEAQRIKEMVLLELRDLAEHRSELEKEYARYPENDRILNALLLNQQKRTAILDKILNTLDQVN
jgi:hypothetical protein